MGKILILVCATFTFLGVLTVRGKSMEETSQQESFGTEHQEKFNIISDEKAINKLNFELLELNNEKLSTLKSVMEIQGWFTDNLVRALDITRDNISKLNIKKHARANIINYSSEEMDIERDKLIAIKERGDELSVMQAAELVTIDEYKEKEKDLVDSIIDRALVATEKARKARQQSKKDEMVLLKSKEKSLIKQIDDLNKRMELEKQRLNKLGIYPDAH